MYFQKYIQEHNKENKDYLTQYPLTLYLFDLGMLNCKSNLNYNFLGYIVDERPLNYNNLQRATKMDHGGSWREMHLPSSIVAMESLCVINFKWIIQIKVL